MAHSPNWLEGDRLRALDARWIASVCNVSIRTARHWQQAGTCPTAPARLLSFKLGDVGALLGRRWRGWRFADDALISPAGEAWTPAAIENVRNLQAALDAAHEKLARYRDGVPVIDRDELARLQRCADQAAELVRVLARFYPETAESGHASPAPRVHVV